MAALKPDLVIVDTSQTRAQEALSALGVRTLPLAMHKLSDVRSGLIEVGNALGAKQKAEGLVQSIDRAISSARKRGNERKTPPRVLAIIDRAPKQLTGLIAAGPGSYLNELMEIVGVINVMADAPVRYPKISEEHVLRARPDIILDLSRAEGDRALYNEVGARAVHITEDAILLRPSARVEEALERMWRLTTLQ